MNIGNRGRIDSSTKTVLIGFIILVAVAAGMVLYSYSTGQPIFLDPSVEGWGFIMIVWTIGGGAVVGIVLFLVRLITGDD